MRIDNTDCEITPTDLHNNKRNRARLAVLERRSRHLSERLKDDPNFSFDAAERAAIDWAVRVLKAVLSEHGK